MFKGSLVALITPFRDHELDEGAFQEHVAWQIDQGTHGLVPCGTTGESPALADDEQKRLVTLCVEVAKSKRVPVIAGTGTNSTEHTAALTRQAKEAGADAALIVCPYYNKPTQEGLYQHYKAIHDSVDLPIIIYNIPGRSSVDMTNGTMARLAKLSNIVGVKDATNDLARPLRMRVDIGAGFCLLSGEDATEVKVLRQGQASIAEAYADENAGELYLVNANIPEYSASRHFNHQPRRPRKLLLHRKQMNRLLGAIRREGITVVPLSIYFNDRGRAKVELGLARGQRKADKRQAEKQRDWQRSRARILREQNA